MTVAAATDCPRCHTAFETGKDAAIRTCANCDGVLLPRRALQPLLSRIADELLPAERQGDVQTSTPDEGAKSPVGRCPRCAEPMECFGYLGSCDLVIDSCTQCDLIWTDCHELTMMALKHAKSTQVQETIYEARRESDESGFVWNSRTRIRRRIRRLIG